MIRAVILAAGLGTRLRELISEKPKCMVHVNGQPIIAWQIKALLHAGISEIFIVTGHHASVLREYLRAAFPELHPTFVHNGEYATTNNMYSLWLTRKFVDNADLLFMNADVAFEPEVITRLINADRTAVAVDEGSYNEESMKVVRRESDGLLTAISKQIDQIHALGSSIDVYYLKARDAQILYEECEKIINVDGERKQWSEVALDRLMSSGRIGMRSVNISGLDWYEIDNPTDLAIAETLFTASALQRTPPKAYFLDLDGTLYIGEHNIEGAPEFVQEIRRRQAKVVFLSNNSSKSHADYVKRLAAAGIDASNDDVLLSTDALGAYLAREKITQAFVLGTASMKEVLERYSVRHVETDPQAVLLGYHTQLTYPELSKAALLLQDRTLPYYASHLDKVCPTDRGPIPDAGALAELLYVTTGRRPERVFGKPSVEFVKARLAALEVTPAECVVVGDRAYTDFALAKALGSRFIGVLSGECRRADFEGEKNLMIVSSVGELAEAWKKPPSGQIT